VNEYPHVNTKKVPVEAKEKSSVVELYIVHTLHTVDEYLHELLVRELVNEYPRCKRSKRKNKPCF
jgi:hypothetical protein